MFEGLFFDKDRYDLSVVGRAKMNERLRKNVDTSVRTLSKRDILDILRELLRVKNGQSKIDDID